MLFKETKLIIILILLNLYSIVPIFATTTTSTKDRAIANKEEIIYWMIKNEQLEESASPYEKQQALKTYLKRAENGGYRLPPNLAMHQAEINRKKALNKSEQKELTVSTSTLKVKNVQNKTVNILAVLIDFPDLPYDDNRLTSSDSNMYYSDYNRAHYQQLIFSNNGYLGPSGQSLKSAYQYYQEVSGNTLFMQGTVINWVTAASNAAVYGANDPDDDDNDIDVKSLVREAITQAVNAGGFNLADYDVEDQFDRNGNGITNEPDGIIDHVMIFHSSQGEETGGGVLGDDAIWSHRGFVDSTTWGYTIPGTNYAVMGYTIEPIDAAIGVVVHEFGHDLGVADEYNTDSSESADGSPVGFWSVMAVGTWAGALPGSEPTGFSPLASDYFQQQFDGNWTDTRIVTLPELTANSQTVTLSESSNKDAAQNLIKIEIPNPTIDFFPPFTDEYQYYSNDGNLKNNSLSFQLTIPSGSSMVLRMKAHWNIELDYDYARILVNGTALAGSHTSVNNPRQSGISNYITDISKDLPDATGDEGWVDLSFDVTTFQGQTVSLSMEYVTDPFVGGYGFVVDDIELVADGVTSYFDGAEIDGSVTLSGFSRVGGTRLGDDQAYWIQMRGHQGADEGLSAENYQKGMLVWFDDPNYSDNHVNVHPGHGFIGVVDARQVILSSGGLNASSTTQVRDATFSFYDSATSSIFSDADDYSTSEQPSSGMILSNLGLSFSIQTQATDSSSADILLSVAGNYVPPSAAFTTSTNNLTANFTNTSSGGEGALTYSWSFGDGTSSSETSPTHLYSNAGTYSVSLTVTDSLSNSHTTSSSVGVTSPALPPPTTSKGGGGGSMGVLILGLMMFISRLKKSWHPLEVRDWRVH